MSAHEDRVAALAFGWLGTPYRHQASLRGVGCDCLGLVHGVWRELGHPRVDVPAYGSAWGEIDGEESGEPLLDAAHRFLLSAQRREPKRGDVVAFRMLRRGPAKHCGIVVDGGTFVHAQAGASASLAALSEPWRRRVAGLFTFPEPPASRKETTA